jgi:hypothetical protein
MRLRKRRRTVQAPPRPGQGGGKAPIATRWRPDEQVLRQLALHGIPARLRRERSSTTSWLYWSDRGEPAFAWNAKFRAHVIRRWREQESRNTARAGATCRARSAQDWEPGPDATRDPRCAPASAATSSRTRCRSSCCTGPNAREASRTWNSRFVIARQAPVGALQPRPWTSTASRGALPADWQPAADVYDILRMANIDSRLRARAAARVPDVLDRFAGEASIPPGTASSCST